MLRHTLKIFMSSFKILFQSYLVILLFLVSVQVVSGWSVQNMSINPSQGPISPQTPVTVTYTVHFDPWLSTDGLTFPSLNTLDMYTELENAKWVVSKTEIVEDIPPMTSQLLVNQGIRARIDGWGISYSDRQIDLNVQLRGVAPNVNQSQDKTIIRIQEIDSSAQPIQTSVFSKKYQIYVPTPTPVTSEPTITQTFLETTQTQNIPTTIETPTRKQTYSPEPQPLLVIGLLSASAIIIAMKRNKQG